VADCPNGRNGWHRFNGMPVVRVYGDPEQVKAYSSSFEKRP
jgi:hypothetical protein